METAPQVVFEHFEPGQKLRDRVDAEVAKLAEFYDRITSCRVAIRADSGLRQQSDLYEVTVHIVLPEGREVVATRDPGHGYAHDNVVLAVREAFRAARRQLRDETRKLRGDVKQHAGPPLATVKSVIGGEEYGFLETDDGREIYFHRNTVANIDFDKLSVGDRVSFHEAVGAKGPQASTVKIMNKHRQKRES